LVQVKIVENHQNGKDTHVRGLKVYARDDKIRSGFGVLELSEGTVERKGKSRAETNAVDGGFLAEPDWMGEPELR